MSSHTRYESAGAIEHCLPPFLFLRFGRYVPFMTFQVGRIYVKMQTEYQPQKINNTKIFLSLFFTSIFEKLFAIVFMLN